MTFLAPWALGVGALAAAGVVALHLVAQQRPAAYELPTARFIPDRRTLVRRVATRPRDLLLLALRVLLLLSAAAAFARPVLAPGAARRWRIVLVDRSLHAPAGETLARARALLADGTRTALVAFDSAAVTLGDPRTALDSLARVAPVRAEGSLSAALVAARRAAARIADNADSVALVVVSPVTAAELDGATDSIRARWPGAIEVVRVVASSDSTPPWTLDRAISLDDALGPAVARVPVSAGASSVRVRRAPLAAADSAFASAGGTVIQWDSARSAPATTGALVVGNDVVVASIGPNGALPAGRVLARRADGSPAATEQPLGKGCTRVVSAALPPAGDLPLRPSFQRAVRALLAPCGTSSSTAPADSISVARLRGAGAMAAGRALIDAEHLASPLASWLLAFALLCALAELGVRAGAAREVA